MAIELLPAAQFTIEELADLYNQTRVDYLIPMPMNPARLAEYVRDFDVALEYSWVARAEDGQVLGLCMLGVRPGLGWVTRLGVLPASRRGGTGEILADSVLASARQIQVRETHLEVIKDNLPAHRLFLKKGFKETGEYLVLRRAPRSVGEPLGGCVEWLDREQALARLQTYPHHLTWVTALASMLNAPETEGLQVELPDGSVGWMVYRRHKFSFSHLIPHTEQGDPQEVCRQILLNLYTRYPRHDTYLENIGVDDPQLPAFLAMGYFENFRRIEMRLIPCAALPGL